MLHALSRARNRLVRLRSCEERHPAALVALWEGAVAHLEFEIRMVYLRIEHPAIMDRLREPEKPCSVLYLAEQFTPTDLMELITALHSAGVGRRIDGTRANVEQLVELFSWMFNVRINNPCLLYTSCCRFRQLCGLPGWGFRSAGVPCLGA